MTRAQSYVEDAEECGHFIIEPDPSCPECTAITAWRSDRRLIAITNETAINLSDAPWGSRHLHMRDAQLAQLNNRVVRQPKRWEAKNASTRGGR